MIVPIATTIALLLLFLTPSCGYVSSLRVFFTLRESTRTISLPSLDHSQRSQQSCRLNLAATNDPVAQLPLASASEAERKLEEMKRNLAMERVELERKLEKVELERKLEKMEMKRKLEKMEMERKLKVERNLDEESVVY
jgi:hypothetical protein